MTRYQFLRLMLWSLLFLVMIPLRALAGVTRDSSGKARCKYKTTNCAPRPSSTINSQPDASGGYPAMQPKATRPLGQVTPITPTAQFYIEDIKGPPKPIKTDSWRLNITGKIDRPLTLSLDDIRKRPTVREIITLSCIGNPVGGYALGNAEWHGISLRDLLDEADPDFFAKTLIFRGADGYHDSIPLSQGRHRAALLVHSMNGKPLTRAHGFPLRLLVPGLYGIKQVKWIDAIEVSDESHTGYWQKRDWTGDGKVKVISRIDFPKSGDWIYKSRTVLRGIAFAGDRGIQYVQVSTDGERTWSLARLEKPLSPYSWVFWSFPMKFHRSGQYKIAVRAADQYSGIQRDGQRDPFPSGTSGIHRIQIGVRLR